MCRIFRSYWTCRKFLDFRRCNSDVMWRKLLRKRRSCLYFWRSSQRASDKSQAHAAIWAIMEEIKYKKREDATYLHKNTATLLHKNTATDVLQMTTKYVKKRGSLSGSDRKWTSDPCGFRSFGNCPNTNFPGRLIVLISPLYRRVKNHFHGCETDWTTVHWKRCQSSPPISVSHVEANRVAFTRIS